MGPYLTTPKKEKELENGENSLVLSLTPISSLIFFLYRLDLVHAECKAGEIQWRILT